MVISGVVTYSAYVRTPIQASRIYYHQKPMFQGKVVPRSLNPRLIPHMEAHPRSSHQYGFKNIVNASVCQQIIDSLDLKKKYPNSAGRLTIVDAFSGYGLLSSMINYELKPKNHIIIDGTKENKTIWDSRINFLQNTTGNAENFKYFNMDGHAWETYDTIFKKEKVVELEAKPRDEVHDELLIVANISSVKFGESLFAQWIMCCAYQNWLQRYGRVRMVLLVRESTTVKFLAGPNYNKRNRAALKRDVFTDAKLIAISDTQIDSAGTAGDGYDPNLLIKDQPLILPSTSVLPAGGDLSVVEIVPKYLPSLDVNAIEYLTQVLMYKANNTVMESFNILAPGAEDDLGSQISPEVLSKTARQLSKEDLHAIYDVYNNWAFKPSYEDTLNFFTEETRSF